MPTTENGSTWPQCCMVGIRLTISRQCDIVVSPVVRHSGRSAFRHRSNRDATNFYNLYIDYTHGIQQYLIVCIQAASQLTTRNSSGDEIVNVNFLYDEIVHVLQNTIDSCINSATDRRGYVLERVFPKFSEITQYNGHYAVQGHSRSPILVPIESSYTTSY